METCLPASEALKQESQQHLSLDQAYGTTAPSEDSIHPHLGCL